MGKPNAQYLQNQILIQSLRAKWWMVKANKGLTRGEIGEALKIADNHIRLIQEMNDDLYKLLEKGENF